MLDEFQRIDLYKQLNPNELTEEQFLKLIKEIQNPRSKVISDEYFDYMLWSKGCPSRQETFANFIAKKLAKREGCRILEVGGGRTARLSRMLSEKGFEMTCIDPKLEIINDSNVQFIKEQFDYRKFDLSTYDYVVAQEPCDATEHVVRACIKEQKPFIMTLCGVPHKLISGKQHKDVYEWYDYLVNIAKEEMKLRYVQLNPILRTPILRSNNFK